MLTTTMGQLLINQALPEDMRDHERVLDKQGLKDLLRTVAEQHPEKYRDVSYALSKIGRCVAQDTGSYSFGIEHMRKSMAGVQTKQRIQSQLQHIIDNDKLDDKSRHAAIIAITKREMKPHQEAVYQEALKAGNPIAQAVQSGTRGNRMNLASLVGTGDLMYDDHRGRAIPIPVLHSYSEGLAPEEYWAGAYGARKGTIATKFATQDAGFFGKQLNQVAHRLVVTDQDYDDPEQRAIMRGMPADIDDMDNEGALLAQDTGPYKRNVMLTPKILKHLARLGRKRILVRSPITGGSPDGGVYAKDVGVRERGVLPGRGEQVGLTAAQAMAEPISQGQLSAKHSGGVAGEEKAVSGFEYINQLVQVPKTFKGGAAHAKLDGTVQRIEPGPAGGQNVTINDEVHYVHGDYPLKVKKGDTVEAGDVLSEGLPNPATITQYKGIGEGRRYFTKAMREAMRDAGMTSHRRNVELVARGLINHVRLTDEYQDHVPDDVIPYSTLEHTYKPRDGHRAYRPREAVGKYLEAPALHYTIGTKIRPSMLKDFDDFDVHAVLAHNDPPPFEPEMIRGMYSLQHDPDWMTKMYGSGLKKGLLESVHRGGKSEERGTSFVPSLARSVDFGRLRGAAVKAPEEGVKPDLAPDPEEMTSTLPKNTISPPKKKQHAWFGGKFTPSNLFTKAAAAPPLGHPADASQQPAPAAKPLATTAPKPLVPGAAPGNQKLQGPAPAPQGPLPKATAAGVSAALPPAPPAQPETPSWSFGDVAPAEQAPKELPVQRPPTPPHLPPPPAINPPKPQPSSPQPQGYQPPPAQLPIPEVPGTASYDDPLTGWSGSNRALNRLYSDRERHASQWNKNQIEGWRKYDEYNEYNRRKDRGWDPRKWTGDQWFDFGYESTHSALPSEAMTLKVMGADIAAHGYDSYRSIVERKQNENLLMAKHDPKEYPYLHVGQQTLVPPAPIGHGEVTSPYAPGMPMGGKNGIPEGDRDKYVLPDWDDAWRPEGMDDEAWNSLYGKMGTSRGRGNMGYQTAPAYKGANWAWQDPTWQVTPPSTYVQRYNEAVRNGEEPDYETTLVVSHLYGLRYPEAAAQATRRVSPAPRQFWNDIDHPPPPQLPEPPSTLMEPEGSSRGSNRMMRDMRYRAAGIR